MGEQMDLNFQLFETAMLFITVIVVAFFIQVGKKMSLKACLEPIITDDGWISIYAGRDIELLQRINAHSLLFDSRCQFLCT